VLGINGDVNQYVFGNVTVHVGLIENANPSQGLIDVQGKGPSAVIHDVVETG
jgi:hypothetical protein